LLAGPNRQLASRRGYEPNEFRDAHVQVRTRRFAPPANPAVPPWRRAPRWPPKVGIATWIVPRSQAECRKTAECDAASNLISADGLGQPKSNSRTSALIFARSETLSVDAMMSYQQLRTFGYDLSVAFSPRTTSHACGDSPTCGSCDALAKRQIAPFSIGCCVAKLSETSPLGRALSRQPNYADVARHRGNEPKRNNLNLFSSGVSTIANWRVKLS
jgi:hypothetical protein